VMRAAPTELRVVGLRHGREVDAELPVQLAGDALNIGAGAARFTVPLAEIEGWQETAGCITLYLTGGDVLELGLATDAARQLVRAALDAACAPPEFTRSLRAFGNIREADVAAHDRWFGPILRARAAIEGVSDPLRQCALVDADHLSTEVERVIEALAAVRTGGDPARTRALVAGIEEETGAVREAIARLALAAGTLEGSASDSRLADWRCWIDGVRSLFQALDDAWPAVSRVLRGGA
jgi:hypothetical protein